MEMHAIGTTCVIKNCVLQNISKKEGVSWFWLLSAARERPQLQSVLEELIHKIIKVYLKNIYYLFGFILTTITIIFWKIITQSTSRH